MTLPVSLCRRPDAPGYRQRRLVNLRVHGDQCLDEARHHGRRLCGELYQPDHAEYFLGTTHQLGTSDLAIFVKDANSPRGVVIPNTITIDDSTFNVVITFLQAQSGRVYIK